MLLADLVGSGEFRIVTPRDNWLERRVRLWRRRRVPALFKAEDSTSKKTRADFWNKLPASCRIVRLCDSHRVNPFVRLCNDRDGDVTASRPRRIRLPWQMRQRCSRVFAFSILLNSWPDQLAPASWPSSARKS